MLVTFVSSNSGQILMFAAVARHLLQIVGKESSARGVITFEQLRDAIHRLRLAAAAAGRAASANGEEEEDNDDGTGPPVGLAQRAYPLIELLERTLQASSPPGEKGFILWEAAGDF